MVPRVALGKVRYEGGLKAATGTSLSTAAFKAHVQHRYLEE
jgi:hypothetical protein